jgi:DNA-directed RNA polymerase specialized sigma24 family protein
MKTAATSPPSLARAAAGMSTRIRSGARTANGTCPRRTHRRRARKRGGSAARRPLDEVAAFDFAPELDGDRIALGEALGRLGREHLQPARLVTLRYFDGLTMIQAAEALGISLRTAERHWAFARSWLVQAMAARAK